MGAEEIKFYLQRGWKLLHYVSDKEFYCAAPSPKDTAKYSHALTWEATDQKVVHGHLFSSVNDLRTAMTTGMLVHGVASSARLPEAPNGRKPRIRSILQISSEQLLAQRNAVVDEKRRIFLKSFFFERNFHPSTGLGEFDAHYYPDQGRLHITVYVHWTSPNKYGLKRSILSYIQACREQVSSYWNNRVVFRCNRWGGEDVPLVKPEITFMSWEGSERSKTPGTKAHYTAVVTPGPGRSYVSFPKRTIMLYDGDERMFASDGLNVLAHEFGHVLGLPDIYMPQSVEVAAKFFAEGFLPEEDLEAIEKSLWGEHFKPAGIRAQLDTALLERAALLLHLAVNAKVPAEFANTFGVPLLVVQRWKSRYGVGALADPKTGPLFRFNMAPTNPDDSSRPENQLRFHALCQQAGLPRCPTFGMEGSPNLMAGGGELARYDYLTLWEFLYLKTRPLGFRPDDWEILLPHEVPP